MQFSQLVLHEVYRKFPMNITPNKAPKSYLTVKNLNLAQAHDRTSRKKVIQKEKKQLAPHSQHQQHKNYNQLKNLIKRTEKIIYDKYRGVNIYQEQMEHNQGDHKKERQRAIKGRVLTKSLNLWDSPQVFDHFEENNSVLQSKLKKQKVKEYLGAAIHKTMLIRKVSQTNKQAPQVLSVRLSRSKDYETRRAESKSCSRTSRLCDDRPPKNMPRYQYYSDPKRASTSHQNYRNFRVVQRKSTELLEPW